MNVQVTCDHQRRITSLDIYAGAAHDSCIWRGSLVRDEIKIINKEGFGPYFLLGEEKNNF